MKTILIRLLTVAVLCGGAWGAYSFYRQLPRQQSLIVTTRVRRSDVVIRSYSRGELRATRSYMLTAPNLFGTVQVTKLAPLGSFAHEKDLLVEFDDSEVNSRLEEKQLELDQIDEQIKKSEADLAVRNNQNEVDLLTARFAVRRAELEVKRNELLSAIDAKKNVLSLEEAKKRAAQLQSDIQSRQAQAEAAILVLRERKNKGVLEAQREKARLQQVKLLSPINGLVAIRQNRPNFFFPGMQIPDIREGDQLNPGIPVAEVLDLSELELLSRVSELDRANLREGQDVLVRLDAIPGKTIKGQIKSMSGQATSNVFSSDPAKKFDVVFSIDMKQLFQVLGVKPERIQQILTFADRNRRSSSSTSQSSFSGPFSEKDIAAAKLPPPPEEDSQFEVLLRPGLLADVEIIIEKYPNAINIPVQAVFEKDGKVVTYVKSRDRFEERAVKPLKRSESTMVLTDGLREGEVVALADPTAQVKDKKKGRANENGGAMGSMPGGGTK